MECVIGSRGSKLALWQSEWVKARLEALDPHVSVRIEIFKTSGDVMRDVPLASIGGQGAFTKELEVALLERRVDIAVHSLKDLPTILPEELAIAAITEREDARDALVIRPDVATVFPSLRTLRKDSVIGTSSPRRRAQLTHLRPDLDIRELRGNVDTRLRKLDAGEYDALILASAGLRRLGFAHRISAYIAPRKMLPAVGQGALAIETRADNSAARELTARLNHQPTFVACSAERSLLRALGGGCKLPIAGHAVVRQEHLRLDGLVTDPSGSTVIRDTIRGTIDEPERLGETLAARLLERGATSLLRMS